MIHSIQFVSSCDSTGTCTGSETSTGFTSSPSSILSNSGFLMIGYKWSYQMLAWKQKDTYEFSRQNVDLGASQCCLSELSSAKHMKAKSLLSAEHDVTKPRPIWANAGPWKNQLIQMSQKWVQIVVQTKGTDANAVSVSFQTLLWHLHIAFRRFFLSHSPF